MVPPVQEPTGQMSRYQLIRKLDDTLRVSILIPFGYQKSESADSLFKLGVGSSPVWTLTNDEINF